MDNDHLRGQAAAMAEAERHEEHRLALLREEAEYGWADRCPHCGSEGFEDVGSGTPRICVECGYDEENGTLGVCPGGLHPTGGKRAPSVCCDACYDRAPRDLPGHPRWRSERKAGIARARRVWSLRIRGATTPEVMLVEKALTDWLRAHPA